MRVRVTMFVADPVSVPINQQEALLPIMSRLVEEIGSEASEGAGDCFYTFSPLRSRQRVPEGNHLRLGPGIVEWILSTPSGTLARRFETLLCECDIFKVGEAALPISGVERFSPPRFGRSARFTCAAPIVASESTSIATCTCLRGGLSEALRGELLRKHEALYGRSPRDTSLSVGLDDAYMAHKRWTKRVMFQGNYVEGVYCPFTVTGSPELIRLGYLAGFGHRNEEGFGMAL